MKPGGAMRGSKISREVGVDVEIASSRVGRLWWRLAAVLLVLGAGLMVLSVPIDPPPTAPEPRGTIEAYTASPGRMDVAATLLHNGFLLFGLGLFLSGTFVVGRGQALAVVGAVASGIGYADLSGAVFIDWFDSAAGRTVGVDAAVRIEDAALLPGVIAGWIVPQMLGSVLGPVLLLVGLILAGWFRWWITALPVAAVVVVAAVKGPAGTALGFGLMLALAVLLARVLWSDHPLPNDEPTPTGKAESVP